MQARTLVRLGLVLSALIVPLGWHLGWLIPQASWGDATGWVGVLPSDFPGEGGSGPEISWLGHSGFVLRWQGQTVLLDPNTNDWCTISRRMLANRVDLSALGPVDGVLISHPHFDHLDLPTLRSISEIESLVVPLGSEGYVADAGLTTDTVVSLRVGEGMRIGPLEVIAVPAAHNGSRLHPFESKRLAVGYIIRSDDFTLYYSGDTGFSAPFEAIRDAYHPQLAILPIGAYLPRLPMKYYHLSPEEAVAAAVVLGVETVIPCHFGTFALSLDRPSWALPRFARAAREEGVEWRLPWLLGREAVPAERAARKGPA